MRRLLTGYAVSFNRRHRRSPGQLFQNRYKSVICQEDAYLRQLVRYIHLNPLRAKVVERGSVLFQLDKDCITVRGSQRDRVRARDLLCYWVVVELGMPMVDLEGNLP